MMEFKKIVALANKVGLLKTYSKVNVEQLRPGPVGLLLEEILRTEWLNAIVINKDLTVFLSEDDFTGTYEFARSMCLESLPFGVAEIINNKKWSIQDVMGNYKQNGELEFSKLFVNTNSSTLKCTILVAPNISTQFFHQWQRQRNMWWRKFSPTPGRYFLTDIQNNNAKQTVEILAKYSWGSQQIETIKLTPVPYQFTSEGNKIIQAHGVTSIVHLPTMLLNTICDAYDKINLQGKSRQLFKFHRKLAPFKLTFVLSSSTAARAELSDLARYLCKQLRDYNISTLLIPNNIRLTLETQYNQQDELGAPYSVVLNENTLTDGLCHLRSRDTTLKEQVHVTDLLDYVEKLYRN